MKTSIANSGAIIADTFRRERLGKAYGFTGMGWNVGAMLGMISTEFAYTVQEIESGVPQDKALEHLSARVPSKALKRAIDILINAIKSGSDVHGTLVLINDMLIQKQQSDMKSYAGELTPMSMGYMMVSVVLPSLGMSVFVILGSLAKINIVALIYLIPVILVVFQVFFMGMVSSRRPAIGV